MNNTIITERIMTSIARLNPALAPRWSRALGAVRLAHRLAPVEPVDLRRQCALVALEEKCLGPQTEVIKAIASKVATTTIEDAQGDVSGQLMVLAYPGLALAVRSALEEVGIEKAIDRFCYAVAHNETSPDRGQCFACARGERIGLFGPKAEELAVWAGLELPEGERISIKPLLERSDTFWPRRDAAEALARVLRPELDLVIEWANAAHRRLDLGEQPYIPPPLPEDAFSAGYIHEWAAKRLHCHVVAAAVDAR